jgi:hypothetical protein
LRGAFRQVYISSTHSAEEQSEQILGTSLALDGHWSTESVRFVHDGAEASRLNKVIWQIAQSPIALEHLRVCYKNEDGAYNCGKCEKCLRTMTNLYIAGVLEKSETLPHHIDPALVAAIPTITLRGDGSFHNENLRGLQEKNLAPELQEAIRASLESTIIVKNSPIINIMEKIRYLDHVYTGGYVRSVLAPLFGRRFS